VARDPASAAASIQNSSSGFPPQVVFAIQEVVTLRHDGDSTLGVKKRRKGRMRLNTRQSK